MSNYLSVTQNPNGYNHTAECNHILRVHAARKSQAARLAASGNVTETTFGWHVTDSTSTHLVVWAHNFYICDCGEQECPHTVAVTIFNAACEHVQEVSEAGLLPSFSEEVELRLLLATDKFEGLILQTLRNVCDDLLDSLRVKTSLPLPIDSLRDHLEEELKQLFTNICRCATVNAGDERSLPAQKVLPETITWPPRTKPARLTDQLSAALTPYQLRLFTDGTADPFREVSYIPHAHPETNSQVSHSELVWLYERTADTFGHEIVDELFSIHLGSTPYHNECHLKIDRMQPLYEAFVDTFGETDAHLLFADAFACSSEEVFA